MIYIIDGWIMYLNGPFYVLTCKNIQNKTKKALDKENILIFNNYNNKIKSKKRPRVKQIPFSFKIFSIVPKRTIKMMIIVKII